MDRQTTIKGIIESFDNCAKEFAKNSGGFCEIMTTYKGEEISENITERVALVYYNSYIVSFKYTSHGFLSTINSILEVLVSFDKTQMQIVYPFTTVLDFLDIDTLEVFTIPLISNGHIMKECFNMLANSVSTYQQHLIDLSKDINQIKNLYFHFLNEYKTTMKRMNDTNEEASEDLEDSLDFYYSFITNRACSSPYLLYMSGKFSKAAKKFLKIKHKTNYETRLLRLLKTRQSFPRSLFPQSISENIKFNYNYFGAQQTHMKEFIPMLFSWFVLIIPWAAFFLLYYYLLYLIECRNAVYIAGPIYNIYFVYYPSFFMTILTSYFTRHKFIKLFFKKYYEKQVEMDHITNSVSSDKFMKGFAVFILMCSVIFILLTIKWNVRFDKDGMVDNSKFFSLRGDYYFYSQIKKVYLKADRTNDYGVILDFPSYVIVLDNGKEIDLYDFEEIDKTEKDLIPLLREYNVFIED